MRHPLLDLGRMNDALACFDLCDELHPNRASVLEKRGHVLHMPGRPEEAWAVHRRAYALNSDHPNVRNNIGPSLQSQHLHDDALVWFDLASCSGRTSGAIGPRCSKGCGTNWPG